MTIKMIAAIAAFLLIASGSVEARSFQHHRSAHRHHHKPIKIVTHKRKYLSPLLPAKSEIKPIENASPELVAKAIKYLGMNARQVGVRYTLWCSAFLRKLTNAKGVDDRAISWLKKPHVNPQVGAIAYMRRRGGTGHVGIVIGFVKNGVIIISGNHGNIVAKSIYPKSRIAAYIKA